MLMMHKGVNQKKLSPLRALLIHFKLMKILIGWESTEPVTDKPQFAKIQKVNITLSYIKPFSTFAEEVFYKEIFKQ